jgi:hypothetical protein
VYQGEEGGEEAVDRIRIDNESLVLDFSAVSLIRIGGKKKTAVFPAALN